MIYKASRSGRSPDRKFEETGSQKQTSSCIIFRGDRDYEIDRQLLEEMVFSLESLSEKR